MIDVVMRGDDLFVLYVEYEDVWDLEWFIVFGCFLVFEFGDDHFWICSLVYGDVGWFLVKGWQVLVS